ncbi:hypothetical protein [Catenulispora subtropica]|uniref:CRISPR-associated protein, TIGR02710 family n=1 Tax=Catenulispora subtropica TaxID=450798 RepID=A0ABP5C587_9ACTN
MSDEFEEKLARYERILRGEERYGDDGHDLGPIDQALRFQLDELLEEIVRRTRERSAAALPVGGLDLLVSLSGFSPMGTILTYRLLRPRQLLIIGSEESKRSIDVIGDAVVGPGQLAHRNFNHEPCDPRDPMSIYRLIQSRLDTVSKAERRRPVAMIDITGGKKVMSAAAALAAWQLDLPLCYLDGTYSARLRQHIPGQDRLLLLPNPAALFGDQEMDRARVMFDEGSFAAARARYAQLAESVPEPARARFMAALSDLYQAWCDLDLDRIPRSADETLTALDRVGGHTTSAFRDQLEQQLAFLRRLTGPDNRAELTLCFTLLGRFHLDHDRRDFAALLYHRTIEEALAHRLETLVPGFDCTAPDYSLFPDGALAVVNRYRAARVRLGLPEDQAPPSPVAGVAAAVLLDVLGDPMLGPARLTHESQIRELRDVAAIREQSVLARGTGSVTEAGLDRLILMADAILNAYWQQHGDGTALNHRLNTLAFIKAPF